ncbi:hypothetical protein QTP86_019021 [Hemibagrus guttatus]|nr:hypothetical protein QTP86_019021 [Hemibagrus guttatus]
MEKYRDGQRELHCVFVDLEKAYDRVPSEEPWYCMRKSGVAEKYVRVVQDIYESSRTVVRFAVGQTEEFKVEVGLHQGSALSPFLFAIVMDHLSEEVRQESPWTMMFADDIVICSESREQVEENLERWRFVLERRGMKVSRSKTEYMCVNEREGSGTVRLQNEEVKKVQEFMYLGSTVQSNGEYGKEPSLRFCFRGGRRSTLWFSVGDAASPLVGGGGHCLYLSPALPPLGGVSSSSRTEVVTRCYQFSSPDDNSTGLSYADALAVIKGHLPEGYKFQKGVTVTDTVSGYIEKPTLKEQIHCVLFVLDASKVTAYPSSLESMLRKLHSTISNLSNLSCALSIPQLVLLNNMDQVSLAVQKDLKDVYSSRPVRGKMQKAATLVGLPLSYVLPVKNYVSSLTVDCNTDILLLSAVMSILLAVNDSLKDQYDFPVPLTRDGVV